MASLTPQELQALRGFVTEIVRVAQELAKTVPSGKQDCERIERQGQAALRVLDKVAGQS